MSIPKAADIVAATAEQDRLAKIEADKRAAERPAIIARAQMERAVDLVNHKLPNLIANHERDRSRKFTIPDSGFDEHLFPEDSAAGQFLLSTLREKGYTASIQSKERQNTKIEPWGDGEYDVVDAPGTHMAYSLHVSWGEQ